MTALVRRGLLPILTAAASLFGALLVVACLWMATGCGSAAQRTVSALAVAAVAADDANATAYEIQARDAVESCQESGGGFADCWCPAMTEPWDRSSRAECGIEALADLALAGQAAIDAGGDLGGGWGAAACSALAAVEAAWTAAEDPPELLSQARALVCAFGDGSHAGPPVCADPGPPPPCGEGEKCFAPSQRALVALLWGVLAEVTP